MLANINLHQVQQLNQDPLNQEAKRWLDLARVPADDGAQYLLQLMWWGVTEAPRMPWGDENARRLRDKLHDLLLNLLNHKDQKGVLRLMSHGISRDEEDTNLALETLQTSMTPEDAAWRALDALHNVLSDLPHLDPERPFQNLD